VTINFIKYLNIFFHLHKPKNIIKITFGWNILVLNKTFGGLEGYSSVNSKSNLNIPPSQIV
jgi:hypothetical protein